MNEALKAFVDGFRRNANGLALRFGAPVWLVGGAARGDDPPRDWDVRVVVTEQEAWRLFGRKRRKDRPVESLYDFEAWEWRRGVEGLKQSRILSSRFTRNLDFQIQLEKEADFYAGEPRIRLDSAPEAALGAGLRAIGDPPEEGGA